MGIEIERKFLVINNNYKKLSSPFHCAQGYICENPLTRIRIINDKSYITLKGINQGIRRSEYEYEIPILDAKNLLDEFKLNNSNISILEVNQSEVFWNKVKSLDFFAFSKNNIFRIAIPPAECVKLIYQLSKNFKYYVDWGGALIWVEAFELSEQMFESIRKKVVKAGGYVTMIKNSEYLPYVEDPFTINSDRFNISQNIKKSFDPKRIFNPGKMYTGI